MYYCLWTTIILVEMVSSYSLSNLDIVTRDEWQARPPKLVEPMPNPVPYVIIHHSYQPAACYTPKACIKAMQSMQRFHQDDRGWNDIGYSFGVGGDNRAYTGRGWSAVGAHSPHYNNRSIGICVIGDWTEKLPPTSQLQTIKELIDYGVQKGMIQPNYMLLGHRQVRDTECPGDALFNEIKTWPHWIPSPPNEDVQVENVNSGANAVLL
ncbi:peptidoglycan-recognition protein LB isoform X3 [Harmonia axyridis]|uniref:peptidoglycan-recognition protein LB isoform X3 n=1 Tax=Harmonia axyridis TaxID=115357 RepID=UPI001E275130|nr:peptidoglycan-recognition protein LB isoform X3 [Harmonia axyridis]